jgi:hypothetical protein
LTQQAAGNLPGEIEAFWKDTLSWSETFWLFGGGYPKLVGLAEPATPKIIILAQPKAETTVTAGRINRYLSVTAFEIQGTDLSYQWYSNDTNSTSDGQPIDEATAAAFVIPTNLDVKDYYYYCLVTAGSAERTSKTAKVTVIAETAVGDGTPGTPLQIKTVDDLRGFVERVEDDQYPETSLCAVLTADLTIDDVESDENDGGTAIGRDPVNPSQIPPALPGVSDFRLL